MPRRGRAVDEPDEGPSAPASEPEAGEEGAPTQPAAAPRRLRIVIESDLDVRFAALADAAFIALATEAARTVGGQINVTRTELVLDGRTVEVNPWR